MRAIIIAAIGLLSITVPAVAQPLSLEFSDGRVSLSAANVPVRTILAEWARLGGTRIEGADRVTAAPLTLELEHVPEAQALEIILRNVAGYLAAPRRANTTGASAYDRILVMATSSAPAPAPAAAGNRNGQPAGTPPVFRPPVAQPGFDVQPADEPSDVNEPAPFSFPQQNPFQPVGDPGAFGTPMAPGAAPQMMPFGQGAAVTVNPSPQQGLPVLQFPTTPGNQAVPGGGFGIVGAPMPGVVVQPAPPPGTRPPGGA